MLICMLFMIQHKKSKEIGYEQQGYGHDRQLYGEHT